MGRNVFGLEDGADLPERTVSAIEDLYRSVGMPVRFSDCDIRGNDTVSRLVQALKTQGMVALGEHGDITPEVSEKILTRAL